MTPRPSRPADWRLEAKCRGMDVSLFYPTRGEWTEAALEVCRECPVRTNCLNEALAESIHHDHGTWGGTSERERRRIREKRRKMTRGKAS